MRAATWLAVPTLLVVMVAARPVASLSVANYLCLFDAGSAELTPRCQARLLDFAAWWQHGRPGERRGWPYGVPMGEEAVRVQVWGHADKAEEAAGKAASVSRARAEAVAAFLRLNGVPADAITPVSFGAKHPLAPAIGAEPQNRRTEIIFR